MQPKYSLNMEDMNNKYFPKNLNSEIIEITTSFNQGREKRPPYKF